MTQQTKNPLGSRGTDHREDETYIEIQKTPVHLSDDINTGGKSKEYGDQKQQDLETTETVYQEDQLGHDT